MSVQFLKKHWFAISIIVILLLATFFRFYNYTSRYALAGDQARDVLVAREALRSHKLPAIGPFSSAGEFTTGPMWYVWLVLSQAILPYTLLAPWIILSLTYVAIVYFMILIGKELGGKSFGIILGLLTAFSAAQISQSLNVTNPSLVALFSTLMVLFALKYFATNKVTYIFLVGLCIGIAISLHFQAVYLLPFILLIMILKRQHPRSIAALILGLLLPTIPYLFFDFQHNYYNLRGITDYTLYGQYKIYVANRWIAYAGDFIPRLWGRLIGQPETVGFAIFLLLPFAAVYTFLTKKVTKPLVAIFLSTVIVFFLLRYYRGEKFDGYFVFMHPFMLILTGWICFMALKINKFLGIILTTALLLIGLSTFIATTSHSQNETYRRSKFWGDVVIAHYPDKKFNVYGFKEMSISLSYPFILYLDSQNKIDNNGYKIGLGSPPRNISRDYVLMKENNLGEELWDLNSSSSGELTPLGWHPLTPQAIYENTTEWNKDTGNSHGLQKLIELIMSKYKK